MGPPLPVFSPRPPSICSYVTADGVRWPALTAHLAARYRQAAKQQVQQQQPQQQHAPAPASLSASVGSEDGADKGIAAAASSHAGAAAQHAGPRQEQEQVDGQLLLPTERRLLSLEHMAEVLAMG